MAAVIVEDWLEGIEKDLAAVVTAFNRDGSYSKALETQSLLLAGRVSV